VHRIKRAIAAAAAIAVTLRRPRIVQAGVRTAVATDSFTVRHSAPVVLQFARCHDDDVVIRSVLQGLRIDRLILRPEHSIIDVDGELALNAASRQQTNEQLRSHEPLGGR